MTIQNIKGAGGGCFPADTLVNTPSGYRKIQDLRSGDIVFAFDLTSFEPGEVELPGRIFQKPITATFKHAAAEVSEGTVLRTIHHEKGTFTVTGNHYILSNRQGEAPAEHGFCKAADLQVGDIIYTEYGVGTAVTEITGIGFPFTFVYNLEVQDLHTFIAGKIRVHNGGGDKGGGGNQAPNSVRTNQIVRVLNLISEGECVGLWEARNDNTADNQKKSVYFNNTPLKNNDNSDSVYTSVTADQRFGLPSQTYIPGFSAVESEMLVGQTVTTAAAYSHTISAASIDAVRVTLEFTSGLQAINSDNGDSNGTSVAVKLFTRLSAGTWTLFLDETITEMSSGPFQVAYRLPRPVAEGTWEFKVERITADSTLNTLVNEFQVKSYTEIDEVVLTYPDVGLVGLTAGADSTNGRVPTMGFDWGGVKVKIPNNYNATTRVYTGSWSGTWSGTYTWTDNPMWILYDLLTNTRYGLGSKFSETYIDKFSFYAAAVYCDELIDNGLETGTFEPRFTFNAQLMVRENAWQVLQTIAATCNATLYNYAGGIRVSQDRPATITRLITNSKVVEGRFTYTTSESRSRFTVCNVTFSDPLDNFLPKTVSEISTSGDLTRYGYQVNDLAAYGCHSEGQARRAAKWVLDTNLNCTDFVEFSIPIEHADIEPGEIFSVMDTDYAQVSQEGLLQGNSGSTLTLDKPITITTGTWSIDLVGLDGKSIETKTITTGASTTSVITISGTTTAPVGAAYIITGAVSPRQFRSISLTEVEAGVYACKAVQHDPTKYARVEGGIVIPPPVYWQERPPEVLDAPTNMSFAITNVWSDITQSFSRGLRVDWVASLSQMVAGYMFSWKRDSRNMETVYVQQATSYVIPADLDGVYEVFICARSYGEVLSPPLIGEYELLTLGGVSPLDAPTDLKSLSGGAFYDEDDLVVQWTNPLSNADQPLNKMRSFEITVSSAGTVLRSAWADAVDPGENQGYTFPYEENLHYGGPYRVLTIDVVGVDSNGRRTEATNRNFTNLTPGILLNLEVIGGVGNVALSWDKPTVLDFEGVLIWRNTVPTWVLSKENLIYDGDSQTFTDGGLAEGTKYYYIFAAYDSFAKDYSGANLTKSSTYSAQTISFDFDSNLMRNSAFEMGTPGRPTYYDAYYSTSVSHTWANIPGMFGGRCFSVESHGSSTGTFGLKAAPAENPDANGVMGGWIQGTDYVVSFYAKGGGVWTNFRLDWTNPPDVFEVLTNPQISSSAWQRYVWHIRWQVAPVEAAGDLKATILGETVAADILAIDRIQVEVGTSVSAWRPISSEIVPDTSVLQAALIGSIGAAQLDLTLGTRVNLIDDAVSVPGSVAARINTEATTREDADSAMASDISTLSASVDGNTIAIQEEATVRADETGSLLGKYTVKIDNNGYVSGFGLASTANTGAVVSDFSIRSDSFRISSPSGPGVTPITPFVVYTTPQVINGKDVPPGVYIRGVNIEGGTITNVNIAQSTIETDSYADESMVATRSGYFLVNNLVATFGSGDAVIGPVVSPNLSSQALSAGNLVVIATVTMAQYPCIARLVWDSGPGTALTDVPNSAEIYPSTATGNNGQFLGGTTTWQARVTNVTTTKRFFVRFSNFAGNTEGGSAYCRDVSITLIGFKR